MFAQREEKAAGGGGPNSAAFPHHPVPLSCPWPPPDHLSSPLKSIGGGREHGLLSPGLGWGGGALLSPLISGEEGELASSGGIGFYCT